MCKLTKEGTLRMIGSVAEYEGFNCASICQATPSRYVVVTIRQRFDPGVSAAGQLDENFLVVSYTLYDGSN